MRNFSYFDYAYVGPERPRTCKGQPQRRGTGSLILDRRRGLPQTLFKKMSQGPPPPSRMSYESGPYYLHYLIEAGVCYLTLSERGYPKKLAYQYLEELQREFHHQNQNQVETVARPYAFIKFGARAVSLPTRARAPAQALSGWNGRRRSSVPSSSGLARRRARSLVGDGQRVPGPRSWGRRGGWVCGRWRL